jgi:hypothetical protein
MVGSNHNYFSSMENEVQETVPFLVRELNLEIVDARYEPASFGNSYVTLADVNFLVRFVRDRGEFRVDIASTQDRQKWWNLKEVGELIIKEEMAYPADLMAAGRFIREHIFALKETLGPGYPMSKVELVKREDEKWERYYREHSRGA